MSAEQDTAAKSGKKLSALLVLGGVIIIGGGYLLLTWLSPENSASLSSVNINSTTTGSGRTVVESQHYRDLLRADNERGAAEALRNNQTFIASLPRGLDTDHGNNQRRDTQPADQAEGSGQPSTPPQAAQTAREKQREALQKLLARINTQHPDARPPVVAAAMWGTTGAPGISSHASPPGTGTSPQPRLQEASLATPAARTGIQLIPALTRVPAFIDTEVDSDNAVSRVVASVPAGPWAGAVLYSQDARLAGKGMDIHFDRMMWRGMFLKVNAYALNEHTGMSSVASDVNHRWFKHIVLPSVLGGVGSVGSLYKDANTQVIQGNYGSITGRVGMPDGEALAGVIAGGMAERGSQLLTRQAESEPYRQVTVSRGEVVSILFVEPVMSNDISPPLLRHCPFCATALRTPAHPGRSRASGV
ncbi:conjugal transfer protein TraO (plasmid) [Escherichia coli]|nr:conjugal transfer protein TraO [Escherichia coli]GCP89693.1 conjugal transfer protein TraO [Escherichia coli]GCQ01236.1 conjugal transfer protein TraO [Escherichia coli]GCQ21601.1 conjugal transfer protein TraO [Escherichia coli]